jgi:hypothetical protein
VVIITRFTSLVAWRGVVGRLFVAKLRRGTRVDRDPCLPPASLEHW